jgi:excinuclease ABC subunit C
MTDMSGTLNERIRNLPAEPGVYLFKDARGQIIYVGKAKALRNRVRSHFRVPDPDGDPKHAVLMSKVVDFEFIHTDSEIEALILEANFIKHHRPRYNVNLKDDKSYPYIRVTREPYPRVTVIRKPERDGSLIFGPYTDVGSMRQLLSAIRRIFPIRTCGLAITEETIRLKKHKICLQFHLGRCGGPCEGLVPEAEYGAVIDRTVAFIEGRNRKLVEELERRMRDLAENRAFEQAALLRDQIRAVLHFQSRQKVAGDLEVERDLVAAAGDGDGACGLVFEVRDGKIVNRKQFGLEHAEATPEPEILSAFLKQYYLRADFIPAEIHVPFGIDDREEVEAWLSGRRGSAVRLTVPAEGKSAELMAMVRQNARLLLEELRLQKSQVGDWVAPSVAALQRDLGLERTPKRIEAFDISNLSGTDTVASMVLFENGRPVKSGYRKFRIRSVEGIDDFAAMSEAVTRRVSRLVREGQPLPDLILVDGGKGQLSAACEALRACGAGDQPVIGLAKRLEEIFRPGLSEPQTLPRSSPALRLLQRVRDEAHRFAVTFHRSLLLRFGSADAVRRASVDELAAVPGMTRTVASRVKEALSGCDPGPTEEATHPPENKTGMTEP